MSDYGVVLTGATMQIPVKISYSRILDCMIASAIKANKLLALIGPREVTFVWSPRRTHVARTAIGTGLVR